VEELGACYNHGLYLRQIVLGIPGDSPQHTRSTLSTLIMVAGDLRSAPVHDRVRILLEQGPGVWAVSYSPGQH